MKGIINGHRLTQEEDRLFSESVFQRIIDKGKFYSHKSKDEEHYDIEKKNTSPANTVRTVNLSKISWSERISVSEEKQMRIMRS